MRKKILVVDDEIDIHQMIADRLTDVGYETTVASNGEEALRKIQLEKPDLVILDVVMPGIDGASVCATLKEDPRTKTIPIIFLTGLRPKEDELRGVEIGGYPVFAKPFNFEELLGTIREMINKPRI